MGEEGPYIRLQLHDSGLYSGHGVLGVGKIEIKRLVDLGATTKHRTIECLLEDVDSGEPLLGMDGLQARQPPPRKNHPPAPPFFHHNPPGGCVVIA